MNKWLIFVLAFCAASMARADGEIWLPNIPGYLTGTASGGHNGLDVNVNSGTVTATNPSVGPTGSSVPASATFMGAKDGSGNLVGLLTGQQTMANSLACVLPSNQSAIPVSESGTWNITNISGTVSLPTGAATAVKQPALGTAGTASADVITVQGITSMTPLLVNGSGSTQPVSGTVTANQGGAPWSVSGSGNFTVVQPTGTNLHAVIDSGTVTANIGTSGSLALDASVTAMSAKLPATLGIKTSALSLSVAPSSDGVFPVTGTFWQATQPVSGTVTANQGTANATPWNSNVAQINGITPLMGNGVTGTGSQRVTVSSDNTPFAVKIDQTTPGTTNLVSIGTNGTVQTKAPLNSTGSGSSAGATVSTVITLTAPANAVGAFLMNVDTSTANIRWAVNRTATTTLGQQLQPGRNEWIQTSHDISLVAESGTQTYDVQWISQ